MNQPRQSPGQPTGGQFAEHQRPDGAATLATTIPPAQAAYQRAFGASAAAHSHAIRAAANALREAGAKLGADKLAFEFDNHDGRGPMFICGASRNGRELAIDEDTQHLLNSLAWPFDEKDYGGPNGEWTWNDYIATFDVTSTPKTLNDDQIGERLAQLESARKQLATEQFDLAHAALRNVIVAEHPTAEEVTVFDIVGATGGSGPARWSAAYIHGPDGVLWNRNDAPYDDPFTEQLDEWTPWLDADIEALDDRGALRILTL